MRNGRLNYMSDVEVDARGDEDEEIEPEVVPLFGEFGCSYYIFIAPPLYCIREKGKW